jgi:hypothetical protein
MFKPKSRESSGCTHIHTTNKAKEFKQTLPARKLMATVFGQERSTDGGIRAKRDHNNVKIELRNIKNTT